MRKKDLYGKLVSCQGLYEMCHQRTAEIDIEIIRKFSEGKGAVQIAMEVPCAEATIYRAVNRVRRFLSEQETLCLETER